MNNNVCPYHVFSFMFIFLYYIYISSTLVQLHVTGRSGKSIMI